MLYGMRKPASRDAEHAFSTCCDVAVAVVIERLLPQSLRMRIMLRVVPYALAPITTISGVEGP